MATPTKATKSKAELLQEALLLEQLGSEWTVDHAGAVCNLSAGSLYRSSCPRIHKRGDRSVKGKPRVAFLPAEVRTWNQGRTLPRESESSSTALAGTGAAA